jgi:hypothetical protein
MGETGRDGARRQGYQALTMIAMTYIGPVIPRLGVAVDEAGGVRFGVPGSGRGNRHERVVVWVGRST